MQPDCFFAAGEGAGEGAIDCGRVVMMMVVMNVTSINCVFVVVVVAAAAAAAAVVFSFRITALTSHSSSTVTSNAFPPSRICHASCFNKGDV